MNSVIVLAGGMGKRMNAEISKQFLKIDGKPILYYCLDEFNSNRYIDEIVVVIREEDKLMLEEDVLSNLDIEKNLKVVAGGRERMDSVKNGLAEVDGNSENVLIHDGVRPFVSSKIIEDNIRICNEYGACVTAMISKDTIKIVDEDLNVLETPRRSQTYIAQTPQTFKKDIIERAFRENSLDSRDITDDSMLVEALGIAVKVVEGDYKNIKITTPEDIEIGSQIAKER